MKEVRRNLGKKASVSLFTLGTMRALKSEDKMYQVVKEAERVGINHIETAQAYGPAESYLGTTIKKLEDEGISPKGDWVITTKILPGVGMEEGQEQIKGMLNRIGKSKIKNLAVHGLNLVEHLNWALKGEGRDLLEWAKDKDLIEQIGFSSHGSNEIIEEALSSKQFDFCSLHVHLLDPSRLAIAEAAIKEGIGVMAISPADKGGRLYEPSQTFIEDCSPIEPLEIAYRFLITKGITTLTIGASEPEDLNLVKRLINCDAEITKTEREVLDKIYKKRVERLGEDLCGQCKECLPCPNDIPIPEILRLRNLARGHDLTTFAQERYNLIGKAGHWWEQINATACKNCAECIPRCPNRLKIPDLLLDTHNLLQSSSRKRLWG